MYFSEDDEDEIDVKSESEVFISDVKIEENSDSFMSYEFLKDDENFALNPSEANFEPNPSQANENRTEECFFSVTIKSEEEGKISEESNSSEENDQEEPQKYNWDDPTSDPDYQPTREIKAFIVNNRVTLKHYKRTSKCPGCIFKYCDAEDIALLPDIVRIKLLQEYKLYILKSSKICTIHMRDQNWEDLLLCTYKDFTAIDIEDILRLLKQASQITFDFECMDFIPTRFIRYWMNVNKVQFQRIYNSFPQLQTLGSPKTALSVYLMHLQKTELERIALLMQVDKDKLMKDIELVQAIVPCRSYEELNEMFKLEY